MAQTTFTYRNTTFKVDHMMEQTNPVIINLGWTHFAAVSRLNGSKTYYANLVIQNGQVLHSVVVL